LIRLFRSGDVNQELVSIIRENVRTPDETVGDLYAQCAANQLAGESLNAMLDDVGVAVFDGVAVEIIKRSETAMRQALSELPDGIYQATSIIDGVDDPVTLQVAVRVRGDEIDIDFAGSSPEQPFGINVVLNYTAAYSTFAIKAAFAPDVPHNAGSFRPIHVTAPERTILNCSPPAPVASRHLVGHFVPSLIFEAVRPIASRRVTAYSSDALWMTIWRGCERDTGDFMLTVFQCGGMGARPNKDGLNATSFPSGVRAVPTEIIETTTPLIQLRRELRIDSGGPGEHRGGLGQSSAILNPTTSPVRLIGNVDRVRFPARGAMGGLDGARGVFRAEGGDLPPKRQLEVLAGTVVAVCPPGGGGYGDPLERPVSEVVRDVVEGYVSAEAACEVYGVELSYVGRADARVRLADSYLVDREATARSRAERAGEGGCVRQ
jgi:N-methylhydantoinase B